MIMMFITSVRLSCGIALPFISLFYLLVSSSLPLVEVQILSVCFSCIDPNHAGVLDLNDIINMILAVWHKK
jgi:hypothetical protein